ncbi:hypothetical protein ETAA8_26980 [Anatilimnocola aggregata]|uniref:Uncharacterized protein n=1 Tax=Anatilimnocola aggregata TaxID=2528021 RepID=A0A517YBI8_9BACT|nr:hypothetical protein [Anatilimnocola aggregata]QDU27610.1 hypothetical protein ETAA8_26980 [Anatilimnocola aggregata]
MKYTNFRRAAIGAVLVLALGCILLLRDPNRVWGERDYLLASAATILIVLNLGASYYMDKRNHEKSLKAR